jgi:hypothetical protein
VRIVSGPIESSEVELKLEKKEGDHVVKSKGGRNLLLIQSNVPTALERMVCDLQGNYMMLVEEDIKVKLLDRNNFMFYLNNISAGNKVKYRKQLLDTVKRFDEEFDKGELNQKSTIVCELPTTSLNQ